MTNERDPSRGALFAGPGEARARCRAVDWGATPLGRVEAWPPGLRAAVRLCLDTPSPAALWAGRDLRLLPNDAYAPGAAATGRPLSDVACDELATLGPALRRALEQGEAQSHGDHALTPVRDDEGRVLGVLDLVVAAWGERERAEASLHRSEAQYRTLFDSIDEGFCIIEVLFEGGRPVDYRFLEANPAFERQTGLVDAIGRRMRELAPTHEEHWFEIYGRVALTGEPQRFERPAEALGRVFDVYAFRVGEPGQRRVAVLFNDVTERRRAEEQLRESDRRKDEFLAMLGHELRNPLGAIRNAAAVIRLAAPDDAHLQRASEVLDRQSAHMTRLIDGLLEVSRIARGKIHLDRHALDLRAVLERVVQDRRPQTDPRGLELTTDLPRQPLWVLGDPVRLAQVFDNLVGNAVKFTAARGRIDVHARQERGCAEVRVRDTGVGIRPEMLERVFEPFQQEAQEIARAAGGLGLGLALARGLVELHGGSIRAHSDGPGTGTEIEVRLPLTDPPAVEPVASRTLDIAPRRVLVVEDNPDAARSLADLLALLGHDVRVVETGAAALGALRAGGADVVLCDLGLPGMSGYDVARAVRADASLRHMPLVAVTGYGQPSDRARAADAGFDDHLTKPVDVATLTDVLRRLTGD